jgi:hypothetical protein
MVVTPNRTSSQPRFIKIQRQGRVPPFGAFLLGLCGAAVVLAGCSQAPHPVTRSEKAPPQPAAAEQPTAPSPSPDATAGPGAEAPPPEEPKTPLPNSTVTYVDSAESGSKTPQTLAEAAKAEKERRAQALPPKIVITNKTLPRYAKGQLTVADPHFQKQKANLPATSSATEGSHDEQYWRGHVLDIRLRWRHAVDEVKELEQNAADWRRRFYAQDDPFVRDGQIKPEWDRVLDRLRQARVEVDKAKKDLADFLETGRREGAFPGWLREGVEQEPPESKPINPTDAIEPPILKGHGA